MGFKFPSSEKLKSKKAIDLLFAEGESVLAYPLRLIFMHANHSASNKVAVSVGKNKFKAAVDRNRIKRLLRENYRLNRSSYFNNITTHYTLMILYIGSDKPTFREVERAMHALFEKFRKKISP